MCLFFFFQIPKLEQSPIPHGRSCARRHWNLAAPHRKVFGLMDGLCFYVLIIPKLDSVLFWLPPVQKLYRLYLVAFLQYMRKWFRNETIEPSLVCFTVCSLCYLIISKLVLMIDLTKLNLFLREFLRVNWWLIKNGSIKTGTLCLLCKSLF